MKFRVANLGRIKAAEFDIKPLTVFIGKASTNKTWTAYALYGILRTLTKQMRFGPTIQPAAACDKIDAAVDSVGQQAARLLIAGQSKGEKEQQSVAIEVSRDEILDAAQLNGDLTFSLRSEDLASILAVEPQLLKKAKASLVVETEEVKKNDRIKGIVLEWTKQFMSVVALNDRGRPSMRFGFAGLSEKLTVPGITDMIRPYLRWLAVSLFDDAMAFPAERKGISAIFSLVADAAFREQRLGSVLNTPSVDFIRFLASTQRTPARDARSGMQYAELLESDLMNGRADFTGPAESRSFNYLCEDGHEIQIHASASFVRSMAGLDLYLRSMPQRDVIVIDEPEMNAHPEAQLKLVELFAMLANDGHYVIVTTHSPYFVDHLNNLLEGSKLTPSARKRLAEQTKLGQQSAFISPEKVSAYLFNDSGEPVSLIENGSIDISSFAAESDYVVNLYSEIVSEQQEGR